MADILHPQCGCIAAQIQRVKIPPAGTTDPPEFIVNRVDVWVSRDSAVCGLTGPLATATQVAK